MNEITGVTKTQTKKSGSGLGRGNPCHSDSGRFGTDKPYRKKGVALGGKK